MAVESYDVIIAGAGPAGSSLAIRLATAGLSVLLVEQKKFPREKLCGEFISPECLVHFEELGISSSIAASHGTSLSKTVFYSRSGKGVSVRSEWFGNVDSLALGLSRAEMDTILVERARSLGVDVLYDTSVNGLLMDKDTVRGVTIKRDSGDVVERTARLTIDATGRTRSLARRLALATDQRSAARHVAFKTHLRGANVAVGACEIYVYRGGYGGCNRVENDLYNLCFIASVEDTKRLASNAERVMREVVFTNARARSAMSNAVVAKPWLAVPIERFGRGELVPANGLICVGDAAAFIDPFTGSGMLLALESGKIAAKAIIYAADNLDAMAKMYKHDYAAAFDTRLRVCSMLRQAAFTPLVAELAICLLSLNEKVRRKVAQATRFNASRGV